MYKFLKSNFPKATRDLRMMRWRWMGRLDDELLLAETMLGPQSIFLDVGVHRGAYSFCLARHVRACIGFEPLPLSMAALRAAAPANCLLYPFALSDENSNATLRYPDVNGIGRTGFASLVEKSFDSLNEFKSAEIKMNEVTVETKRLDDVIDGVLADVPGSEPRKIDLIKIDVEGHETAMLAGATKTIEAHAPAVIIEAEERHAEGAVGRVFDYFQSRGYKAYGYQRRALRPIRDANAARDAKLTNFVFLP